MRTKINKQVFTELMTNKQEDVYTLAKRMDVAPSTIYRILNGDRGVGGELIPKLLRAFNLDERHFDQLFIFEDTLPNDNGSREE